MSDKVYQIITEQIIKQLEDGVVPWRQSWSGGMPVNIVSKKPYRGINALLLGFTGHSTFATFRQAKALGIDLSGKESYPVIFYKANKYEDKKTGEEKVFPMLRYYRVFPVDAPLVGEAEEVSDVDPIEEAEAVVEGFIGRPKIQHGGHKAYYRPSTDTVQMPEMKCFHRPESYYAVLFHELSHSTGSSTRLNRAGVVEHNSFGDTLYSNEELVAEIGSAFVCGTIGIEQDIIADAAAYCSHWLRKLKEDSKFIVKVASEAQKASDLILNRASNGTVKEE